jgi:hypothetical protein
MRKTAEEIGIIVMVVLMLFVAAYTGAELQRLRLENEHLRAECAMKNDAIRYLNDLVYGE